MSLSAPNDWHHDRCGCNLCAADRAHLAEEIEVASLADLATALQAQPQSRMNMALLGDSTSLISGIGSIALGIYQITKGDMTGGIGLIMAGLTALHHHQTVQAAVAQASSPAA